MNAKQENVSSFSVEWVPSIYFVFSNLTILSVFIYVYYLQSNYNMENFSNKLGPNQIYFISYFKIQEIVPILFHTFAFITFLFGLLSITLNQLFLFRLGKSFNSEMHNVLVKLAGLCGLASVSMIFLVSISPFIEKIGELSNLIKTDFNLTLPELLFYTRITLTLIWAFLNLIAYNGLKTPSSSWDNWFRYTTILSFYIFVVTFVMVGAKLIITGIILKDKAEIILNIAEFCCAFLPYLINVLIDLTIYSTSFAIACSILTLNQLTHSIIPDSKYEF